MNRRVRRAVVVLFGSKIQTYHNDTTITTPRKRFDYVLPRSCPKITPRYFTRQCESVRENTAFFNRDCATSPRILGQAEHVRILSNNYFAREFTRFPRARSWQVCQKLSQNSALGRI
jgi:hypothetical protein